MPVRAPDPRASGSRPAPRTAGGSTLALRWARARTQSALLGAIAGTALVIAVLMCGLAGIAARAPMDAVQHTIAAGPAAMVSRTAHFAGDSARSPAASSVRVALEHRFAGVPVDIARTSGPARTQSWRVTPDASRLTPANLPALHRDFAGMHRAIVAVDGVDSTTVSLSGQGEKTVVSMQRALDAFSAVLPVPSAVLVVAAVIALCLLAQLLMEARDNETRLMRARGAGIRALVAANTVEALVATVVGAVVGAAVVVAGLALTLGMPPLASIAMPCAAVVVGASAIVVAFQGVAAARTSGEPRQVSGRIRFAVSAGLTVVVIAAAALSLWRFVADARTGAAGDPLAVIAPAAGLCALAVLAVLAFGPASRGIEHVVDRSAGVSALPMRLVARHAAVFAAPVALLTLAVAVTTFAGGYQGTWQAYLSGSSRIVVGADARLDLDTAQFAGDRAAPLAAVQKTAGVRSAVPAATIEGGIGPLVLDVVATSAAKLSGLDPAPPTMFDTAAAVDALEQGSRPNADGNRSIGSRSTGNRSIGSPANGIRMSRTARTLTLRVSAVGTVASSGRFTAWLTSTTGEAVPVLSSAFSVREGDAGSASGAADPSRGPQSVTVRIPAGGPWTLSALDASVDLPAPSDGLGGSPLTSAKVTVDSLSEGGSDVQPPSAGWTTLDGVFDVPAGTSIEAKDAGIGFSAHIIGSTDASFTVRLAPAGGASIVPIVLSAATAAQTGLHVGSTTTIDLPEGPMPVRVAAIQPHIPGTESTTAALVDLPQLTSAMLRIDQDLPAVDTVFLRLDPGDVPGHASGDHSVHEIATAAARAAGDGARAVTPGTALATRFNAPVVTALSLGSYGCCALAAIALAACLAALWRRRSGETVILRAVGFAPRQQATGRGAEAGLAAAYAFLCGLVAGILIALITGNTLAQSSVPAAPPSLPVHGEFDLVWLGACLLALLVVLALIVLRYAAVVRRDAVHAVPGRTTT
jgi:hypothetical protein